MMILSINPSFVAMILVLTLIHQIHQMIRLTQLTVKAVKMPSMIDSINITQDMTVSSKLLRMISNMELII